MRVLPPSTPPELPNPASWHDLWLAGFFAIRDFTWDSHLASEARQRELQPLGIGSDRLEELDLAGAFQPIAFAHGGNPPDVSDLTPYEQHMTFREEQPPRAWEAYAWDAHGHPHTTSLYSPWQLLYLDDALERSAESLPLGLLAGPRDALTSWLERLRGLLADLQTSWAALHQRWQPLLKLLVRLQNRYLPEVTRRTRLLWDVDRKERIDPWAREVERFDATAVADELEINAEQILHSYWFLTERGIDLEPRDGMEILRRARPRAAQETWRGSARLAVDHLEAAQMLRLFLTDLTGEPPARPTAWRMDGRQPFRAFLFDRGPVPGLTREEVRDHLLDIDLQPHAVHVVGEGKSEKDYVLTLLSGLVGAARAETVRFSDLKGSGSAPHLGTIVRGLSLYVSRTLVIVDSEGEMEEYVQGLERSGDLPVDDILRFSANIEDDNFTPQELIDVLTRLAAEPPDDRPAVDLTISVAQLETAYAERRLTAQKPPGWAGVLLHLAEQNDPPARYSKPEFACALAERMLEDLEAAHDVAAREAVEAKYRLLKFVVARMLPPLMNGL
jgi:hypothetical protein